MYPVLFHMVPMTASQIASIPGKITDAAQDAVEQQKQKVGWL